MDAWADLRLQIEWGADEALDDLPIDRLVAPPPRMVAPAPAAPLPRPVAVAPPAPAVLVMMLFCPAKIAENAEAFPRARQ
jgi:hypothetical protein